MNSLRVQHFAIKRRDFAVAASSSAAFAQSTYARRKGTVHEFSPAIKIALQSGSDPQANGLNFVKQVGLE